MDKKIAEVAIGSFLHDAGKISQRSNSVLSEQSQNITNYVCPTRKDGSPTHLHAAHTNDFLEKISSSFPSGLNTSNIINLASYHHRPNSVIDMIVQQADWLSAGQDRIAEEDAGEQGKNRYLKSIFASLARSQSLSAMDDFRVNISAQAIDERSFPQSITPGTEHRKHYTKVLDEALQHLQKLKNGNLNFYMEQLDWIYQLYSTFVPSSLMDTPDVSLYDHARTTAAFATALHQYHKDSNSLEEAPIRDRNTKKFRLVAGDMSGIQSYIFHFVQENPKGAGKRLRARSFYLGLLSYLASQYILDQLGLPCFNKIMDAGGRFTLLVPNTKTCVEQLEGVEETIQNWFFETYQGLINLNLDYQIKLSGQDCHINNFNNIIRNIGWRIEQKKKNSFSRKLITDSKWDSSTFIHKGDPKQLADEENHFFESLGSILPKSRCLIVDKKEKWSSGLLSDEFQDSPFTHPFNEISIQFRDDIPQARRFSDYRSVLEFVPGIEKRDLNEIMNGQYFANYIPKQKERDKKLYTNENISNWLSRGENTDIEQGNSPYTSGSSKTFAHLAVDSLRYEKDQLQGTPALAVLKADVDRLGWIMSEAMGKKLSVGRFASLSRQIDLFFKGILPNMMLSPPSEEMQSFQNIYTVYAGGDDLLLVGPWPTMIQFADYLYEAFRKYTCYNDSVTISAGLTLVHPRFPLAQAVAMADEMLDGAKQNGRNKFCIFDTILSWPQFHQAIDDGRFFDKAMRDNGAEGIKLTKGFVYRLLQYQKMAEDVSNLTNKKWRSHLSYDIARNVEWIDKKRKDKPPGLLRVEKITGLTADYNEIKRLKVSVTYCLYLNRGGVL